MKRDNDVSEKQQKKTKTSATDCSSLDLKVAQATRYHTEKCGRPENALNILENPNPWPSYNLEDPNYWNKTTWSHSQNED